MSDAAPLKRHRVHHGLSGARLVSAGVLLEFWTPATNDGTEKPYHREQLSSVEWVDLIASVIVGDLEVSATDLNALRSDVARLHERWRASFEQQKSQEAEQAEDRA
jgi:hypothetical protein